MLRQALLPLAFLACAAPAGASTLDRLTPESQAYRWTGTPGDDSLTVTAADGGALTFTAADEIVVSAPGCSPGPATTVTCVAGSSVNASGGDGNDVLRVDAAVSFTAYGGGGDDALTGGPLGDSLSGDAGTDTLNAGAGDDYVSASDGVGEEVDCGDGTDTWTADATDALASCEVSASERAAEEWRLVNQAKRLNMDGDVDSTERARRTEAPGTVVHRFAVRPGGTVVRKLRVGGLARRSTITFRCRGGSCPFAKRTLHPKRRRAALEGLLGGRALRRGTSLTIEIDARGHDTKLFGYRVRSGRQPIRWA